MIIKYESKLTGYQKYFTEAEEKPRNPKKVIRVKVNDNRRKDFNSLKDDPDEDTDDDLVDDELPEDEGEELPEPDTDDEGDDTGTDEPEEDAPDDEADTTDEGDAELPEDDSDELPEPDEGDDTGDDTTDDGAGDEAPDDEPPDGTDDLDDTGDQSDEGETDSEETSSTEQEDNGNTTTAEQQLKYVLFLNFKDVYNGVENFINKLSEKGSESTAINKVVIVATNKLMDLSKLIFEYMTIKFIDAPYIESKKFYTECIVTISKIFDLIENNFKKTQ